MRRYLAVAAIVLTALLAGCGDDDDDDGPTAEPTPTSTADVPSTGGPRSVDQVADCLDDADVDYNRTGAGPGGLVDSLTVILVEEDTAGGVFFYDTEANAETATASTQTTVDAINEGGANERTGTVQYWIGNSKGRATFDAMKGCVTG